MIYYSLNTSPKNIPNSTHKDEFGISLALIVIFLILGMLLFVCRQIKKLEDKYKQ